MDRRRGVRRLRGTLLRKAWRKQAEDRGLVEEDGVVDPLLVFELSRDMDDIDPQNKLLFYFFKLADVCFDFHLFYLIRLCITIKFPDVYFHYRIRTT